jgi:hypothetical protein
MEAMVGVWVLPRVSRRVPIRGSWRWADWAEARETRKSGVRRTAVARQIRADVMAFRLAPLRSLQRARKFAWISEKRLFCVDRIADRCYSHKVPPVSGDAPGIRAGAMGREKPGKFTDSPAGSPAGSGNLRYTWI